MPETDPPDATLLALDTDPETDVPYLPTGLSPYHAAFRRMQHRLLRTAARANDCRPYHDAGLTLGHYPGRATINANPLDIPARDGITLPANALTRVWIDDAGDTQTGTDWPDDPTTCLPLAEAQTDDATVTQLTDRRGDTLYRTPSRADLGFSFNPDDANRALDGAGPTVTANALGTLTDDSSADGLHTHRVFTVNTAGPDGLDLYNASFDPAATTRLRFLQPATATPTLELRADPDTGQLLQQAPGGPAYALLGAAAVTAVHPGPLTASTTLILGPAPHTGTLVALTLSVADNTQSPTTTDGVTATLAVNTTTVTSTPASLTASDGNGFRSTHRGDGTPAAVTHTAVQRGDLLTATLTLNDTAITQPPTDLALVATIRAASPE